MSEYTTKTSREAFEALAMPALDMLYAQAMKFTNNPDDAEDLVQDTFEKGYKAFHTFQENTNINAWLMTILRNTYFNQYQKNKRRPQRANADTGEYDDWDIYEAQEHSSQGLQSAEEQYIEGFAPSEILQALQQLSPERKQVFIDIVVDGKSYQEVSDEQHIPIGTVMSRLNRARKQLREALEQYGEERGYDAQHHGKFTRKKTNPGE